MQKPLRVHGFLADVPIHDVWAFRLHGGGVDRTLRDFRDLMSRGSFEEISPVVKVLFKIRTALGKLFGWDDRNGQEVQTPATSYIHRLAAEDREQSLEKPGDATIHPFHLVYAFQNEMLEEVINATVHAFSLMTMERTKDGYRVYWAIYGKNVTWWTPVYMALINPFRRFFVYPAIIRKMERAWVS